MESFRFDSIAKRLADRRLSRRQSLTKSGAGLATWAIAATGIGSASAQDATPEVADPGTSSKVPFLFVQTYQSGRVTPVEGSDRRYTLALEQGYGQTVYFSDRPERIVGTSPTPEFFEGLGFAADNPPNAALVMQTAPGESDVAVVELFNPLYEPTTQGVRFEVEVLANWRAELGLDFTEEPTGLASLVSTFGTAQLFIDDCMNSDIVCYRDTGLPGKIYGVISSNADMCWNYSMCQPCEPYAHTYPSYCAGYWYWREKCNRQFDHCDDPYGFGCDVTWLGGVPATYCAIVGGV
jgi:hypothetical protein